MKKSKLFKLLVLMLCVVMVASALAGCGNGKKSADGDDEDINYPGSEVKVNGDDIYPVSCEDTLDYWCSVSTLWSTAYGNFGDTPLGKQIAQDTGIKVRYIHPETGQESEQFNLMLASDELPGLVGSNWNTFQGGPDKAIEEGYIYSLNNIWKKWSPGISKVMEEHSDWAKDAGSDGGNYYAYPFIRSEDYLTVGSGLIIRDDMLKKLNMELPETMDEWEAALTAFKEKLGVEKPLSMGGTSLKNFMTAYGCWTGMYLDNGKVVYGENQDGYKDFLAKMADWYAKGLIDPDISTVEGKTIDAGMLSGKVGVTAGWIGSAMGKLTTAARANGDNNFLLAAVQFPVANKGDKVEYAYKGNQVLMSSSVAITKRCNNVELAARFLDYGYTTEGHNLYNFGVEGVSYNWVDKDGVKYPEYTDLILHNPDGLPISQAMGQYMRSCYNGLMLQDRRYLEQYYQQPEQIEALDRWSQNNMGDHLLPSVTVLSEESDRYSEINANLTTYMDEKFYQFITGEESIDKFDAYREQLKKFGIDELLAMKQSAYERWQER